MERTISGSSGSVTETGMSSTETAGYGCSSGIVVRYSVAVVVTVWVMVPESSGASSSSTVLTVTSFGVIQSVGVNV